MTEATTVNDDRVHWPSLIAAISAITAVGIAIGLGLPLLSLILDKRGISSSLTGINSAMAGIAAMMAAPVTTWCAHRYGVATTMIWAIVIASLSSFGFYYIVNYWAWFPLRIVFHGATTALFILSEFWINVAAPPKRRGLILGLYASILSVGFATGTLIFSLVGSEGVLPFIVGAGIILLAVIPIFVARRESPVLSESPHPNFFKYITIVPTAILAVFIFGAVEAGGLTLLPLYATRIGFTEAQAGGLLTAMAIGNFAFQIPVGMLSDRLRDRRALLTIMGAFGLVGALLLPMIAPYWTLLAALLLIWGGVVAGLYTVGLGHIGSRFHGTELAAANAAFIFFYALGTVAGPAVIGTAMDLGGTDGFAWALTGFFGCFVVFAVWRLIFHPTKA